MQVQEIVRTHHEGTMSLPPTTCFAKQHTVYAYTHMEENERACKTVEHTHGTKGSLPSGKPLPGNAD